MYEGGHDSGKNRRHARKWMISSSWSKHVVFVVSLNFHAIEKGNRSKLFLQPRWNNIYRNALASLCKGKIVAKTSFSISFALAARWLFFLLIARRRSEIVERKCHGAIASKGVFFFKRINTTTLEQKDMLL